MKQNLDFDNLIINALINNPKLFVDIKPYIVKDLIKNKYSNFILELIKEHNDKYGNVPTFPILSVKIEDELAEQGQKQMLDHLSLIESIQLTEGDIQFIRDNLNKRLKENKLSKIKQNIDKVDLEAFQQVASEISLIDGTSKKWEIKHLWDKVERKERVVLPTNLELIDKYGIAKGEIGLLLAGTGIGKSVFLTFLASELMLGGYKTLHIAFEGNIDDYINKHRNKLNNPTEEQLAKGKTTPNLKVVKLPNNSSTTSDIEDLIKQQINNGFIPDAIVLDYVDCLVGSNRTKELWINDIAIINELEHLAQKYNIALWSAVQSNRSGLNKELGLENAAGSIQKLQKATMIIALTRNPEQQNENRADLRLLKNRWGKLDISQNCVWNPEQVKIEAPITDNTILL